MDWKKNDQFQVMIEDMSDTGEGIGKLDGFIWFIKDAMIGDVVEAKVMKVKKSYGFARLIRIVEPSKDRVVPACGVARQCGGCQLQQMSYQAQLRFKENKVFHHLKRIGGLDEMVRVADAMANEGRVMDGQDADGVRDKEHIQGHPTLFYPIIGMDEPWRYRNKAQFPVETGKDGEIIAGFYAGRTHSIVENDDCLLGAEENQVILDYVKGYMKEHGVSPYDEENHRGTVRHVLIRKGFATGELMVCLVVNGRKNQLPGLDELVDTLTRLPGMCSVSLSINLEKTNVILGKEIMNLYGPGYITDYIGDVQYRISPLSFYQVNPVQTEKLYGKALEYAGLTGDEVVWDLYCGIGTISLFLAKQAKKVYGVEIVPQAIADARVNAQLNGIENVEFFVGKAEEVLPEKFEKEDIYADVIVVDPPRKGCDQVCLDTIVKMRPKRVVYVSCDPATLARDLKYLRGNGFEVLRVCGVDMFPHSGHVECVVEIRRVEKSVRRMISP